jgi:DNA-directed RNA polymerase subunit beta'
MDVETFSSLRIGLATSDDIRSWSNGEVKKPETINYRTLKPEKDGLFCEKIFGPTKDWECSCGKYKRVRFKDIVCERCGVQVTKSSVRRERMGHIELAAPVTHIWYFKGVPSRLGYLLNMAPKDLEKIIYFAAYRVMEIDVDKKEEEWLLIKDDYTQRVKQTLDSRLAEMMELAQDEYDFLTSEGLALQTAVKLWEAPVWVDAQFHKSIDQMIKMEIDDPKNYLDKPFTAVIAEGKEGVVREAAAQKIVNTRINDFRKKTEKIVREYARLERPNSLQKEHLAWRQFLSAEEGSLIQNDVLFDYFDYYYGDFVITEIGALAVQKVLAEFDIAGTAEELRKEIAEHKGAKQTQAIKRLKVVSSFLQSSTPTTSMVLDVLPVLPPEIRPMVQLDGGRFATSDLNDLYRRVINRNNRLKRFIDLGAVPKTILNNEKRMLQEAVDALFDNGRRGRPVTGTGNRPLKSLSDLLKGKQGRFRQNLLGKRVDYSGRSVIVVGPQLKMHQCGLPKIMALELFKPYVMKRLVDQGIAQNIKSAKRMVERSRPQVWDVLEEVIRERPVLLNRAPTLHRLGIQAFEPLLVEGKAIQLHPLVCAAFNADFDGDQMAVHLPLSVEAQAEARLLMLASNNILKPSDGKPVATPSQDMIIGLYFMTTVKENGMGEGRVFGSVAEAQLAFDSHNLDLQALVKIRIDGVIQETTLGRTLFAQTLPEGFVWEQEAKEGVLQPVGKKGIGKIVSDMVDLCDRSEVSQALDRIKDAGFYWATRSGVSMAIADANFDFEGKFDAIRAKMILDGEREHTKIQESFDLGGITDLERRDELGALWFKKTNEIQAVLQSEIPKGNAIRMMVESGARGNWIQVRSVLGMRGPVATSSGDFAPMPVKGNYLVGLTANEYFINATGARKGNADTAMKTSAAGYLTRRLVDVAQDVIVREEDCLTTQGLVAKSGKIVPFDPEDKDKEESFDSRHARTVKAWRKESTHYTYPNFSAEELLTASDSDRGASVAQASQDAESLEIHMRSRRLARDVMNGKVVVAKAGEFVSKALLELFLDSESDVTELVVRSPLTCKSATGVCASCYGESLATRKPVELGEAIGIIGAQSIGEPGTQLTMRTFHTGGAAEKTTTATILKSIGGQKVRVERLISYDITQGLTGVTDQLEARIGAGSAAKRADMAWWKGQVQVVQKDPTSFEFDADVKEWLMETEVGFVPYVPGEVTRSIKQIFVVPDPANPEIDAAESLGYVSEWTGTIESVSRVESALGKKALVSSFRGVVDSVTSKAIVIRLDSDEIEPVDAVSKAKAKASLEQIPLSSENGPVLVTKGQPVFEGTVLTAGKFEKTFDVSKEKFEFGKQTKGVLAKGSALFKSFGETKSYVTFDRDVQVDAILMEKGGKLVSYVPESSTKEITVQFFVEDPKVGTGEITYFMNLFTKKPKTVTEAAKSKVYALSAKHGNVLVKQGDKVKVGQALVSGKAERVIQPGNFKIAELKKGKISKGLSFMSFVNKPELYEVYVEPQTDKDYEDAIKSAENFQFGRSNTRLTRKLHPDLPVAFLSNIDDLLVANGTSVLPGDFLKDGIPDPREVLYLLGPRACAAEIIRGVQAIYGSQGVPLHDKHLEVIVRQMLGKVMVLESGETTLQPGEVIDSHRFQATNGEARANGRTPASARQDIMGMTRASLAAQSWLSAASFQETTRVLTQAALDRREDKLEGLKENVIIGKLIPAGTGLKQYRDVEVTGTEEAKAARYPNRIWEAPEATEAAEEFSAANLFSADLDDWTAKKED